MPPRVPNGAPSACSRCEAVRGMRNDTSRAVAERSPTAKRLISAAAVRYDCMVVGDRICAAAMLSKFAILVSSGRNSPASTSRPSRSRTDCAYSARFRRWNDRRPGEPDAALASEAASSVAARASSAASEGRRPPAGGIWPARTLRIIFSVTSRFSPARAT